MNRKMFCLLVAVGVLLAVNITYAEHEELIDPLFNIAHSTVNDNQGEYLGRVIADFNNDGELDLACSLTHLWGNAGGPWFIYIKRSNGKYFQIGDIFFHPFAFNIRPYKSGRTVVTTYERGEADSGVIIQYEVSSSRIKIIDKKEINLQTKQGKEEYLRNIENAPSLAYAEFCRPEEYVENKKCKWQREYWVSNF